MPSYPPYNEIKMSGKTGGASNNNIIIWSDIVTPTTGNNFTIDISVAGFKEITNIQITPESSSTSVTNLPLVIIKSYTLTAVVVNLLVSSAVAGSVLTITQSLVYATNLSGVKLHVRVEGL